MISTAKIPQPSPNLAEIRRGLETLVVPGSTFELRAPNVPHKRCVSGYYDNIAQATKDAAIINKWDKATLYITANRLSDALLARRANKYEPWVQITTSDDPTQVVRRRYLPIDCDVIRPAGISATDEQKQLAMDRAREVYLYLVNELGWPDIICCDSGNGAHLLPRINLENTPESEQLVSACLQALNDMFGDGQVKVDLTMSNASRIIKLPGTVAKKGDHTNDRPHRVARLMHIPDPIEDASHEQLLVLAEKVAKPEKSAAKPSSSSRRKKGEKIDVPKYLAEHGVEFEREASYKGGQKWVLEKCVWCGEEDHCAYVIQFESGAVAAGCQHDRCKNAGNDWFAFRDKLEPGWRDRKTKAKKGRKKQPEDGGGEGDDVKLDAREHLDPASEVQDFLKKLEADGVSRLRFWKGGFLLWTHGAYRDVSPSEIRARLLRFINPRYERISSSHVSTCVDQARAQALLDSHIESPAWVEPPVQPFATGWKPRDILSTKSAVIHLPSLADGLDDYQIPATPRLFTPVAIRCDFDRNAKTPETWLNFLDQLWGSDSDSIGILQRWFGYCMTPDTSQQKILMVIGPKRSGKGTIARVLKEVVGAVNVAGPTLASLATNFGLWPLVGKTLAVISDARLSGRTDSAVVVERLLSISGEDTLTIDRKMMEPITAKLAARFMIVSNELPRLGDASGALSSRMMMLRLTESFYGRENHDLTDKLLAELPGILLWSVQGWQRLREEGRFNQSEAGAELLNELEDLSSPVTAFVRDCCELDPEAHVDKASLFKSYQAWCCRHGKRHSEDQAGFGRSLLAAFPDIRSARPNVNGKRPRRYEGIRLDEGF